ncbi:MAG: oligosaccharide flippase family protein [Phycisphaerae bacterium]|nr:oligosaccharide flippase family protein [Phycisphaerae bacterium]
MSSILKRLFKNSSMLFGGSAIAGLMGLASISFAARTLGAEILGVFALIQAYIVIVDRLANFQCWQAIIKFGADFLKQNKKEELKSLVKFCTILDMTTAVVGCILAAAIIYFLGQWKQWNPQTIYAAMLYSLWILFNLKGTPTGLLRLFNKFKLAASANVIAASVKLILAICAYMFSGSLIVFVGIWVIAGLVESALLLWFGWNQVDKNTSGNFLKAKLSLAAKDKNIWKFTLYINLNQSVRLASKEMDVLITGAVLGAEMTGIYKVARQFAGILMSLIEPVSQAFYPELSHLASKKRFIELKHITMKISTVVGGVSLFVWLIFVCFGKWILNIAAGTEYIQAYGVMIIFMFAFVIWGFGFPLLAALLATGKAGKNLLAQSIALLIFLPALYLLLINVGLIGAATAQVIYFAVYLLLMLLFFVKYISRANLC